MDNVVGCELEIALFIAFAVDKNCSVCEVYVGAFERAELADADAGREKEFNDGGIAEGIAALVGGFGGGPLGVDGRKKGFDSCKRDGFWENDWLAEAGAYFGERVALDNIFVFAVMKEGFEGGNFALGGFRLICRMQSAYVRLDYGWGDAGNVKRRNRIDKFRKLAQVDAVGFESFFV